MTAASSANRTRHFCDSQRLKHVRIGESNRARNLRLKVHNSGKVPHTSKPLPWRIETAMASRDKTKAATFETYLKTQSGRAFAKKHF